MKTLKISFLQSTPDFGREGMLQLLKSRYHVVEDDSDFDYLVATPWFYVNREALRFSGTDPRPHHRHVRLS